MASSILTFSNIDIPSFNETASAAFSGLDSQLLKMTVDPSFFLSNESTITDTLSFALWNAFILSFSISPLLLLAFRSLIFQGFYAGIAWYSGISFGTTFFLLLIYSGKLWLPLSKIQVAQKPLLLPLKPL